MKRAISMLLFAAVALAACGPGAGNATPAGPGTDTGDTQQATATGPAAEPTQEIDPTTASLLATATALASGPTLTPDPTTEALAASFKLPRKGPEAPIVMIYEFSDYL